MEEQLVRPKLEEFVPVTSFTLICGGRVETILFENIFHIDKKDGDALIFTLSHSYKTHRRLAELLRDLPAHQFFSINRSQVIAPNKISKLSSYKLRVGDRLFSITPYYRSQLVNTLARQLDSCY
jgi:DNA-binding LytR/AlgR family response regulator